MKFLINALLTLVLFAVIGAGGYMNYQKYLDLQDAQSRQRELQQQSEKYDREIKALKDNKPQCLLPEGCDTNTQTKQRDARRKTDINSVAKALELYYSDNNTYPISSGGTPPRVQYVTICDTKLRPSYLASCPQDPSSPTYDYVMEVTADGQGYYVEAYLENKNDPQKNSKGYFRLCGGTFNTDCSR